MTTEAKFTFDIAKTQEEIIKHLQQLRTDPSSFKEYLQARLDSFEGDYYISGNKKIKAREGPDAVKEAIEFIKTQEKLPKFELGNKPLEISAKTHCEDMCKNDLTGHKGSDNSTTSERISRVGNWQGAVGQCIGLQQETGLEFVLELLVDDGLKSRNNRKCIFNPLFKMLGVSCGKHKRYTSCAVVTFANSILEGQGVEATQIENEYNKAGFNEFGADSQIFNFDDMQKALQKDMTFLNKPKPDGATQVSHTIAFKTDEAGKTISVVTFKYMMKDGSVKTEVEEYEGKLNMNGEVTKE